MLPPLSTPADKDPFPPGLNNAYFFSVFNALSFQLVLSSPMVLYAKSLHASATVLGIITGMMPLLTALQIPAASTSTASATSASSWADGRPASRSSS
jgi:hypothetical protein